MYNVGIVMNRFCGERILRKLSSFYATYDDIEVVPIYRIYIMLDSW
jgi:hypothetical protein